MAITRIKKSVASRIASSSSRNIPSRLQAWAQNHVEALAGTNSHTTDGSRSNTATPDYTFTPDVGATLVSSSSSLPMLELALEATKINTRSCLKKPQPQLQPRRRGRGRDQPRRRREPAKHVGFVYDDALLTCIATGTHLLPETKTAETQKRFIDRSQALSDKRKQDKKARRLAREITGIPRAEDSSSDEDSSSSDSEDEEEDDTKFFGPYDAEEQALNDRTDEAERNSEVLTMHTVACGGLDFALYVTRSAPVRAELERTARYYSRVAKVASYRGEERRYAYCGATAETELPRDLYDDYRTSMSGQRVPKVVMPKAAATVAPAETNMEEGNGSLEN